MSSTRPDPVIRRKVFYLPGYDPFPPRRYRELYRKESAKQAQISGYDIRMDGHLQGGGFGWQVHARIDGQATETEIEVLVWSDIVQGSRRVSVVATYLDMLRTAWIYLSTGALFRLMRLRKGPVIAALYPVVGLIVQLLAAIAAVWLVWQLTNAVASQILGSDAYWLAAALGGVSGSLVLRWFRDHDGKFFVYYLMHDFSYSAADRGAYPAGLEARLHDFRVKVSKALDSDVEEVLVVGHSSGAYLAISLLADLIRLRDIPEGGPRLALLSLGQVVPMVSFLPHAERLRGDLRYLSTRRELTWVDVTAPGDGCCFALCDPVAVSGQASAETRGPLVISAAFTQSLSPARWRALRWRFFRLHFQYLCAFDQPKDYDYFQITAGPLTLADRYAGRASSRSRIDRAVSKYTSVRP
jgi:hypothetical protein